MLYGVVEAFRNGRLPTNDQIDKTLRYILDHSPVDVHKLSPEGRNFVQDAKDILETARLMVRQKNADERREPHVEIDERTHRAEQGREHRPDE